MSEDSHLSGCNNKSSDPFYKDARRVIVRMSQYKNIIERLSMLERLNDLKKEATNCDKDNKDE